MALDVLPPPGEFKTTEEIRDARFAQELRAKRRRMLLWSAPLMVLALLVALKLLSAVAINIAGTSAFQQASYDTAADRFRSLQFFNVIEPWKAHFNRGTAIYSSGDFWNASGELTTALDLVPKAPDGEPPGKDECAVRTNLSLSYEGLGDEALAASDPATATTYYNDAQEALSNCGESGGNGGEEAQEAEERQQESQQDAQQQEEEQQQQGEGDPTAEPTQGEGDPTDGSAEPTETGDSSGEPTETDSSDTSTGSGDPRQNELESRNSEAQQSRDAEEQESGGGNGAGQNW